MMGNGVAMIVLSLSFALMQKVTKKSRRRKPSGGAVHTAQPEQFSSKI